MSLLTEPFNPRYLEALAHFRLIDDTFFDAHMDGNIEAMQLLLNTFFHRNDIIVKEVVTQKSAHNLYGRSARKRYLRRTIAYVSCRTQRHWTEQAIW